MAALLAGEDYGEESSTSYPYDSDDNNIYNVVTTLDLQCQQSVENCSSPNSTTTTQEAMIRNMSAGLPCDWYGWDVADIVLFALGTIGNVSALILMRRRGLRSRSYALSLSFLALFNSLALFVMAVQAADRLASKQGHASLETYLGTWGCKIYRFALPVVQLMSHWVVVFITTERFVAICFPLSLSRLFSPFRSRCLLIGLLCGVILCESWRPFFDYQEQATERNPAQCWAEPIYLFQNIDLFFHQLLLLCLLPAILIFIMNTAVIFQIYRASRQQIRRHRGGTSSQRGSSQRGSNSKNASNAYDDSQRNRKTTILLLAVSCSFFVYISPLLALMIYIRILHIADGLLIAIQAFSNLCTVSHLPKL